MIAFVLTAGLLILGMLLRRLPRFPAHGDRALSAFVIHVSLPGMVLARVPELHFEEIEWAPLLFPWLMVLVSAPIVWMMARAFKWPPKLTGALMLVVPLGNTSFLGVPMVEAFYGRAGVPWALLYDQVGSFLALSTWGAMVVSTYGDGPKPTIGSVAKSVVRFPPFIALMCALVLREFTRPPELTAAFEAVGASLVPVVMVSVGLQLRLRLPAEDRLPFAGGLVVKLVVAPLIAWGVARVMGWSGLPTNVSIFEAAMPPMVIASVLATEAGLAPRLASAMVGYGIVGSFGTLPFWAWLLGRG